MNILYIRKQLSHSIRIWFKIFRINSNKYIFVFKLISLTCLNTCHYICSFGDFNEFLLSCKKLLFYYTSDTYYKCIYMLSKKCCRTRFQYASIFFTFSYYLLSSKTIFFICSHFCSISATNLNCVLQRSRFCPS